MRVARWLLLGIGGLVAAVALALGIWAVLPPATPALDGPDPIAALERVVLGGAEQTLLVRGRDRGKPALLYVHGGPGFAQISIARHYSEELERHFVVVHWDQRGAGASCQGADFSALTQERLVADLVELAEQLRARFGRVYLLGHSWGTVIGALAVQQRPELFAA